jgi:hypothetical protein
MRLGVPFAILSFAAVTRTTPADGRPRATYAEATTWGGLSESQSARVRTEGTAAPRRTTQQPPRRGTGASVASDADLSAVAHLYEQLLDAHKHLDVGRFYAACDPSFFSTDLDGNVHTLDENVQEARKVWPMIRSFQTAAFQVEEVRTVGQNMFVKVRVVERITIANPRNPAEVKPLSIMGLDEDTWRRDGGTWRLASARVIEQRVGGQETAARGSGNGSQSDEQRLADMKYDLIKQQMQAARDATRAMACVGGTGYGCGSGPH